MHVDHGLHPERAVAARAAAEQCQRLGVPLAISAVLPGRHGGARWGSEASLRAARYEALTAAARDVGAHAVVVAHHRDDQIETLILRALRGAGLRGLAGMSPQRRLAPGVLLVRPFLGLRGSDLRLAADAAGLADCLARDPSNRDLGYLRNRVRHRLLPTLEHQHGAALRDTLGDVVSELGRLRQLRDGLLLPLADAARQPDGAFELKAAVLQGLPSALRAGLVLECLHRIHRGREPRRIHVERLLLLAERSRRLGPRRWHLPGGCRALARRGTLRLIP